MTTTVYVDVYHDGQHHETQTHTWSGDVETVRGHWTHSPRASHTVGRTLHMRPRVINATGFAPVTVSERVTFAAGEQPALIEESA